MQEYLSDVEAWNRHEQSLRGHVHTREVEELAARHPRLGITTPEAAWYLREFLRLHPHLDPERVGRWIGERPAPSPASV